MEITHKFKVKYIIASFGGEGVSREGTFLKLKWNFINVIVY